MNTDIWETIMYHCTVCDAIKIFNLCRAFQDGISDNVFRKIAIIDRGHLFWEKANERDVNESDPKSTYREELVRIYEFEKKCGQRFKNEDYFSLWDAMHSTRTQRIIK